MLRIRTIESVFTIWPSKKQLLSIVYKLLFRDPRQYYQSFIFCASKHCDHMVSVLLLFSVITIAQKYLQIDQIYDNKFSVLDFMTQILN